jgi:hypothetical protein
LTSVNPEIGPVFVCPICLKIFTIESIYNDELSEGHVWPDYFRKKSIVSKSQSVLLCKTCNSRAGSRGDKQMQLLEQVKDGEKTGRLYGERRIKILQTLDQKPIELNAKINRAGELIFKLIFKEDRNHRQWLRNNPKEQENLLSYIAQDKCSSVLIYPPKEIRPNFTRTGWLTSAYLLAFYTFGYKYIFNVSLNPVRKHILDSFENEPSENLIYSKSDVISVRACETHNYSDPGIELCIPISGDLPVCVEVSFLNYHVKLPFPVVSEVRLEVLHSKMPAFEDRVPELINNDASLRIPLNCTKHVSES